MSRIILEDTIADFSPDKFERFFRDKSTKFAARKENVSQYNDEHFKDGIKLGEITFAESEQLGIFIFQANQPLSERSGKKSQYEKGKKLLKDRQYDAGIFIFYDKKGSFRFSLIYANYLGRKRDWSVFRRFTYFVSQEFTNKTFLQRIGDGDFTSLDNIKDAFSVDKVTNRFFEEFRTIFEKTNNEFEKTNQNTVCLWLKDKYSQEDYREQVNKFTFTFLGRIIFLYFLLRKGWIENQKDYIRKIVEDESRSNLYLNILQPLFFEVFAKKENERTLEIKQQYKDTPYLNGGLFERSELESVMEKSRILVFFEDKFIRDIILNFFESYNFTIDENSPDDQEVSIDPEMLGKVFENTLAEKERGKKGTFYTPREVVHFMVKESLWQFLRNETNIDSEILHEFIYHDDSDLDKLHKDKIRQIDLRLENIKILDPAVGSAAFPVEMMQVLVRLRKRLNVKVGKNINEVVLKKDFIKNNLYGVDIDPSAIEIAKLRLWLALIVDYEKSEAEPLPNLDFQFRVGNSLQEKVDDIDIFKEDIITHRLFRDESEYEKVKSQMIGIKDKFYVAENETKKKKLKNDFDNLEHSLIQAVLKKYEGDFRSQFKNKHFGKVKKQLKETVAKIDRLEQKIKDGTYKLFKPDFHFSEVFDRKNHEGKKVGGFDIVIGNPPYGVKVEDDIKQWHDLGSKDSYGIFISSALKRFLKPGGVLSYIVSDTWLTIKTHKPLREQVLANQLHKIIRMHQDCFEATVNACIISLTNSPNTNDKLIAADLTNVSTRKEVEEMRGKLYHLKEFVGQFTPKFAVYEYNQDLIKTNSNTPIFVASPKLFILMNDNDNNLKKETINIEGKSVTVRCIKTNSKEIKLVKLGDIADVKVGLQTGDNQAYLFQKPDVRGSYRSIEDHREYLLNKNDLEKIRNDNALRLKVIEKGISKEDSTNLRYFGGRFIVPYDKGGESDAEGGWMPNYYVPTNYYIDWSEWAVNRMKTYTIAQRIKDNNEKKEIKDHYKTTTCAVFRSPDKYFTDSISFSRTGIYSPTFRLGAVAPFDTEGSMIFQDFFSKEYLLGILASILARYQIKNYIGHTVHAQVDELKELGIAVYSQSKIDDLVQQIIDNQKINLRYDYASREQPEIDKLVYEAYGLNKEDIKEVETWHARRYPRLGRLC